MRRHVLPTLLWALALSSGMASRGWSQALELASRGPRFIAAWAPADESVDASNAVTLRRRVSLDLTNVTADEALKEITRQADLEISYSAALLPHARSVSLHVRDITVAAALTEVLLDAGLDVAIARSGHLALVRRLKAPGAGQEADTAVIIGSITDRESGAALAGAIVTLDGTPHSSIAASDGRYRITGVRPGTYVIRARYIGYAPAIDSIVILNGEEVTVDVALTRSTQRLEQLVVTGTVLPTEAKQIPTPISIFTSRDIEELGITRVDELFRGSVPGAIAVDQGKQDGFLGGITFRGGLDFNQVYADASVKVYVDGIEMAYTNALSQLDPAMIDRIEITRGPQASTIYGSNALAGVIQVFTKKGSPNGSRPQATAQAAFGNQGSQWKDGGTLRAEHSLGLTGGSPDLMYNLTGSYVSTGDWIPEYDSRRFSLLGATRKLAGPFTVELSALYSHREYDTRPYDPYYVNQVSSGNWDTGFNDFITRPFYPDNTRSEETYGATLIYRPSSWWEHRLVLGYDNFNSPFRQSQPRLLTPDDTLRSFLQFSRSRASALYNTSVSGELTEALTSSITVGLERWYSHEDLIIGSQHADDSFAEGTTSLTKRAYGNTGAFAQVQVSILDALTFTGGLRGDRNDSFGADYGTSFAPRIGAAYSRRLSGLDVKLRGSYGKAIRAPAPFQRERSIDAFGEQLANPNLGPETQSGFDAGIEVYAQHQVSLEATYYDQRVEDVISSITLSDPVEPFFRNMWQNLGRIRNTGWEFQARGRMSHFTVTGTYSIFNSTVEAINPGALGDAEGQYRLGDRLLLLPRSAGGLRVAFNDSRTEASVGLTHVGSFRNYDRIAMNDDIFGGGTYRGSARAYLIDYPAFVKWSAAVSQRLSASISAFGRVENLTNNYAPEVDNISAVYGRLAVFGVRMKL